MDPELANAVVDAVVAGAVAGAKDTATSAVKDTYAGLKALLARRQVDVAGLERRPESADKRGSLREDLEDLDDDPDSTDSTDVPGGVDEELLDAARQVVDAVAEHDAAAAAAVGVDLARVRAQFLRVRDVNSTGTGFRGQDLDIAGGVEISGIRAGQPGRDGGDTEEPDRPGRPDPPGR